MNRKFWFAVLLPIATLLHGCHSAQAPQNSIEVARPGAYSVALAQDGQYAMVGSLNHGGSFWALSSAQPIYHWNHQAKGNSHIQASSISADNQWVLTAEDGQLVLWHRASGEAQGFWNIAHYITAVALSSNGQRAIIGAQDYNATVLEMPQGKAALQISHNAVVNDVSLDDAGKVAATATADHAALVWNLHDGQLLRRFEHASPVYTVQLSRDGRWLFSAAENDDGKLWDLTSGALVKTFASPARGHFSSARFNDMGSELITGHSNGAIQRWLLANGQLLNHWQASPRTGFTRQSIRILDVAFGQSYWLAAGNNGFVYELR